MMKLGTLGLGVELDFRLNESWNIRLQANSYNFSDTLEEDDIEYTGEVDLLSYGALIDWRPFSGTFRLTAGVFSNSNELRGQRLVMVMKYLKLEILNTEDQKMIL
jgi:hypothetical protein